MNDTVEASPRDRTLHCIICTNEIPEGRATRQTATCSEPCKDKLDAKRAAQRADRKCPHCLHPSTPEEREDYRRWRVERGQLKRAETVERDHTMAPKRIVLQALKHALGLLDDLLAHLRGVAGQEGHPSAPAPDVVTAVESQISDLRKILDPKTSA